MSERKIRAPEVLSAYWSKKEAKIGDRVELEAETQDAVGKNAFGLSKYNEIIVLFHDLNPITSVNLGDYIKIIADTIRKAEKIPEFVSQTRKLQNLLKKKGIK